MTNGRMRSLSHAEMLWVEGGDFWEGFVCGAGIVGSLAATFSPEPLSKITLWGLYSGTVGACGIAFF
jgi:hypothetical protein